MKVVALLLVFLVSAGATLVAGLPLAPILGLAGLEGRGLGYERAAGTVWRGEIAGLRAGPERLGDLRLALEPEELLRGRIAMRLEASGALNGRGVAELALGRSPAIRDALVSVGMADLGALHPELKDRGGAFVAEIVRAETDASGACRFAEGRARTDVLTHGGSGATDGALAAWRGPALEGPILCENGDLVIRLAGADASARVAVEARIDLASGSTFLATVETQDPNVRLALGALGFSERDGAFAYAVDTLSTDG